MWVKVYRSTVKPYFLLYRVIHPSSYPSLMHLLGEWWHKLHHIALQTILMWSHVQGLHGYHLACNIHCNWT